MREDDVDRMFVRLDKRDHFAKSSTMIVSDATRLGEDPDGLCTIFLYPALGSCDLIRRDRSFFSYRVVNTRA